MGPQINLFESQLEAAEEIRRLFDHPTEGQSASLVAILGLSGVGKDTLWRKIQDEFPEAEFVDYHSIWRLRKPQAQRKYVTTLIPAEVGRLEWPGDVNFVTLKGMAEEEARTYVSQRATQEADIEKIVQQSLGIPLLADRILSRDLSDEEVDLLAGTHLSASWNFRESKSDVMKYLKIRPLRGVHRIFLNPYEHLDIFHDLSGVLSRYEELQSRGIELASPLFNARNSYSIYEEQDEGEFGSNVTIFAPNITQEDYLTIRQELLPEGEVSSPYESTRSERSRFQMFGAGWRKVEIYMEPEDDNFDTIDVRYFHDKSASRQLENWKRLDLNESQLPQSFLEDQNKGKFFLFAHEHGGSFNLKVGWMAETLLQNLGIPYVASYHTGTYSYKPERQTMEQVQIK